MDLKVAIHNEASKEVVLDEYTKISIEDLSNKQNASLKEIFLGDFLCFVDQKDIVATTDLVISKMRYGANIIITGSDVLEISRMIMNRNIPLNTARDLLYSEKKSCYTYLEIISLLESKGLKILRKILTGLSYSIVAERPDVTTKK